MRTKRTIVAVVIAVVALGASFAFATPPTFSITNVAKQEFSGEPTVVVDQSTTATRGTVYYIGVNASKLFISNDNGATFHDGPAISDFGDADIAVDTAGNVFASALLNTANTATTIPVTTLSPGGTNVVRTRELLPGATGVECDRQWTAAGSAQHVVTSARCGVTSPRADQVWTSSDGWITAQGPFTIDPSISVAGPIAYTPSGLFVQAFEKSDGVYLAKSADNGHTWSSSKVSSANATLHWPVVGRDDANNLFVVYSTPASTADNSGGGYMVFFTRSTDGGATWSAPTALSSQVASPLLGNTPSSIFPWVSAGAAGKVAVSWWQARDTVGGETDLFPDTGLPTTTWDVKVARSDDATSATPTWSVTTAVSAFHTGSECTFGIACVGPQGQGFVNAPTPFDRRDADYFGTAISPTGALYIAYPQDRPQVSTNPFDLLFSWIDFKLARQTGGTLLR